MSIVKRTELFEDLLKEEFLKRKSKNSSYSLRAYAKSLGISASPLSAILNGKRPVTSKMKTRLGLAIGLSLSDIEKVQTIREYENIDVAPEYQQIEIDKFDLLSSPYNFAILELFELQDFREDPEWMAKKLKIEVFQVHDALGRLTRLGFLEENDEGRLVVSDNSTFTTSLTPGLTDESRKRFQKDILTKSLDAIDNVPIEGRDHSSVTFAINEEDLEEAKELTKKYRRDMIKLFNKRRTKTAVYQLQIGLFPLSE
jgi:uncharacterized protein (TIGR02147 family)